MKNKGDAFENGHLLKETEGQRVLVILSYFLMALVTAF